ncbi:DUF418 domain-containing protein [Paenibacillus sp. NPDC057967]|uniref:DUF418 domain-containing protein n=1 Tax=Paenibacillus sp. NPDC057967 TaxID=3346293 RepID=UPI0036DDD862
MQQPSIMPNERIGSLDMIRGLALFGILLINVGGYRVITEGMEMPAIAGADAIIQSLITVLVQKKFFSIFSFLFGAGFFLFASRAESRGDKPRRRFARRLTVLLLMGIVHIFIFWGSILPMYAIAGFLLIPFYRASLSTITRIGGVLLALHLLANACMLWLPNQAPAVASVASFLANDSVTIFLMFLSGFLAAKAGWIGRTSEHLRSIRKLFFLLLPVAASLAVWTWVASINDNPQLSSIVAFGAVPLTYFYLAGLFWLLESRLIAAVLSPVAKVGRMALTNYVAQSLIGVALLNAFGIELPTPGQIVWVAAAIYAIQMAISVVWLHFFRIGPLEKLWRTLTYGKSARMRQERSIANGA